MLLTVPVPAQEQKAEAAAKPAPEPRQQKVFILKYADPENLRELLSVFGGGFIPNAEMHALAVTAPPAMMQAIEDAIARLDVPSAAPKNFDFTVDLVVGSDADNQTSANIPKDLDSVITQLKAAFAFKNYRLLDVMTLRTRAGKRASTRGSSGLVQSGSNPAVEVFSTFGFSSVSLGADGTTVQVERLECVTTLHYGPNNSENLHLDTDLDIKEGQKVVVGRMGMDSHQALFVVLTVKVVQ
jgi:hypothetical protein